MIDTLKVVREALQDSKRQYGEHPDAFWDWTKGRAALTKLDALIAATEKAEPVAEKTCSTLINGIAYDLPWEAAGELLRLNLELLNRPSSAAPQSAAEPVGARISDSDEDYVDLDDPWQEIATLKGQP